MKGDVGNTSFLHLDKSLLLLLYQLVTLADQSLFFIIPHTAHYDKERKQEDNIELITYYVCEYYKIINSLFNFLKLFFPAEADF